MNICDLTILFFLIVSSILCSTAADDESRDMAFQYALPLTLDQIENYDNFTSIIDLSDEAQSLLEENGFVVTEDPFVPKGDEITDPYDNLKNQGVPIFITTDSLLHLYHIQFDDTLREIEESEFYDDLWETSKYLLNEAVLDYDSSTGDAKDAARMNVAYFSVGLSLLKPKMDQFCRGDELECGEWGYKYGYPYFKDEERMRYDFDVPDLVKGEVNDELQLIYAHAGFSDSPIFVYEEDYSQYIPRGHYTGSEKLKNYFLAMMWYGRISFLLKGGCADCLVTSDVAKVQTIGASMISEDILKSPDIKSKWDRIYNVTSFYVGYSDDLGPYEYSDAIDSVFGGSFNGSAIDEEDYQALKAVLALYRNPMIYGGTGDCAVDPLASPENADLCLIATKGFRIMGQRFIPDSYIFQNLVFPKTGEYTGEMEAFTLWGSKRVFPRGLDVMSLLGSKRASELLDELNDSAYVNYTAQHEKLAEEFSAFGEKEWQKNLYWAWLYSLKPLLEATGAGYPTFMQTAAWQDKELTTALASWTELRHDTILYAKQSYTPRLGMPAEIAPVIGYVEPLPEFYERLLSLSKMTRENLTEMEVLGDEAKARLSNLETILERLAEISTKELNDEELNASDYEFINDFGTELNAVIAGVDEDSKKTTIVADVHTDANTGSVLEEGVGYVKMIVVAYKLPDGRILLGAGPVFSYYEFKHPMDDRLTDEKWREMLQSSPPEEPEWIAGFAA